MYKKGQGTTQDYTQTIKWYTQAAMQGSAQAQVNLGVMYNIGQGITQDYQQAVNWYTQAAIQGLAQAQNNLGLMYANGQGVAQDYKQAVKWFIQAAEQDYTEAQVNLGVMYNIGHGVDKNFIITHVLFNLAAVNGNKNAIIGRDTVAAMLSSDQLNQAQKLASTWQVGTPLPLTTRTSTTPSKKRK